MGSILRSCSSIRGIKGRTKRFLWDGVPPRSCSSHVPSSEGPQEENGSLVALLDFTDQAVPLRSSLNIQCNNMNVDIETTAGAVEELQVKAWFERCPVSGNLPEAVFEKFEGDKTMYCMDINPAGSKSVRGKVVATVPPRYFGVQIQTSGQVHLGSEIKEAGLVSIYSGGGAISCGSISAEKIVLSSGGGEVMAANVMANECNVDTRSTGQCTAAGNFAVGKASCLLLGVNTGPSAAKVQSIISRDTKITAASIGIKTMNTLDGGATLVTSGGNDSHVSLGGMDGCVTVDCRSCQSNCEIDVQLNDNAKYLKVHGHDSTRALVYASPSLRLKVRKNDSCIARLQGSNHDPDRMEANSCEFPRPEQGESGIYTNQCNLVIQAGYFHLQQRSWIEQFTSQFNVNSNE